MRYVFHVKGLDCTMCAMSLEKKILTSVPSVSSVKVSHLQQRIELEVTEKQSEGSLLELIRKCALICDGRVLVEPDNTDSGEAV